ncbi:hypothetical protein C8Q76DRAFT_803246 [Earliella scabrosa]|nr:hypothetical protein C8Q76DRAFT_803246 [Earliella scabrosa]
MTTDDTSSAISSSLARVIILFIESLLFDAFVIIYHLGVGELLFTIQPHTGWTRNRVYTSAITAMLFLAAVHLGATVHQTMDGFVDNGESRESAYHAFFDVGVSTGQYYAYVTQTLIGNALMVHRIADIWNGRKSVIFAPMILSALAAISGYLVGYIRVIFFIFSFAENMASTIIILWGSLPMAHQEASSSSRSATNVLRSVFDALMQSAAIYSVATVSLVVTWFVSPNVGQPICAAVLIQLIGIVFSNIVVRLARESAKSDQYRPLEGSVSSPEPQPEDLEGRLSVDSVSSDASLLS